MIPRLTTFSADRIYRYTLWREWAPDNDYAMFIGLNPSTADETIDDPTIRRCVQFAKDWGYGALCMTNLFAFRATDPKVMKTQLDPVGPDNDRHLALHSIHAGVVVAAWGNHGIWKSRDERVKALLGRKLCYLRLTAMGHPWHPLYLPKTLTPIPFRQ